MSALISAFSVSAALSKSALAAFLRASKSPFVWTPAIAVSPAVLASATLSASAAESILAFSSANLASKSLTFCSFSVDVRLVSALISAFSVSAALSKSALALSFPTGLIAVTSESASALA